MDCERAGAAARYLNCPGGCWFGGAIISAVPLAFAETKGSWSWSCCSLLELSWGDVGLVERLFPLCHWRLQRQREAVEQDRTNNAKDLTDPFSVLKENNVKNVYRPDG